LLKAKQDAKKGSFGVPLHLRNAVTSLMKKIGYGKNYGHIHNHFPKQIGQKKYYNAKI